MFQKAQDTLRKLVEGEKKLKNLAEELNKRNTSFEVENTVCNWEFLHC